MRRSLATLVLTCLVLGLTAVLFRPVAPSLAAPPTHRFPLTLELVADPGRPDAIPFSLNATSDTCTGAVDLSPLPGGDDSGVNGMTESSADPVLSCTWGTPPLPRGKQGYRTVWYQFTPSRGGMATVETLGSTYDTILAVFQGSCGALVMTACNDDTQGFTSHVSFPVIRDQTYYIEVADWQSSAPAAERVVLAAWIDAVDLQWEQQPLMPISSSRHVAVGVDNNIYIIGGATEMGISINDPLKISNRVQRLDTITGNWATLGDMPGTGLANTTGVFLNGNIYIPGGYDGNNNTFNGTHWVYDVSGDSWTTTTAPSWPGGAPLAWATAVVPQSGTIPAGYFLIGGTPDVPPIDPPFAIAQPSGEVFYYLLAGDTWTTTLFPANLNTPRFAHMATWVNNQVCVVGGIGINSTGTVNELINGGECYNSNLNTWESIGDLNYPRYAAESLIGPDGNWYIIGGVDGNGNAVSVTEIFNPTTRGWATLGAAYDLGDGVTAPPRAWPRGATVGDSIWITGGNIPAPDNFVVPLVESWTINPPSLWFPAIRWDKTQAPPNNAFPSAYGLALNQPQFHDFDEILDIYDVFFFDLPNTRAVTIRLTDIPIGSEYDITLYSDNKLLWGASANPGSMDELIQRTLTAGRYYLMIERVFPAGPPDTSDYRIVVEG